MAEIDAEVEGHLAPFRTAIRLLTTIADISDLGAQLIVSEIGTDMDRVSIAAYHMIKDGAVYQDLGHDHFDKRHKDAQTKRLVRRLSDLGYDVETKHIPAAA